MKCEHMKTDGTCARSGRKCAALVEGDVNLQPVCAAFSPDSIESIPHTAGMTKQAAWADVRDKGRAILTYGGVEIYRDDPEEVGAYVMSGVVEGLFPVTDGGPYEVILSKRSWENKNSGGWVQGWMCECFVLGTLVTMADGTVKPIEDVRVGESVLGGDGMPHKVKNVMSREVDEDIVDIRPTGFGEHIQCTSNHPFWAIEKIRCNRCESHDIHPYRCKDTHSGKTPPRWMNAGELDKGMYIQLSKPSRKSKSMTFDMANYCDDFEDVDDGYIQPRALIRRRKTKKNNIDERFYMPCGHPLKRFVKFDRDVAYLFGLYIGDGNLKGGQGVDWSFGHHEEHLADCVIRIMAEKFGIEARKHALTNDGGKHNIWKVTVYSAPFERLVREHCGVYSDKKAISRKVMSADPLILRAMVDGWDDSDACGSVNRNIVSQMEYIMLMNGVDVSVRIKKGENRNNSVLVPCLNTKTMYELYWRRNAKQGTAKRVTDGSGEWVRIESAERVHYNGTVYNLEVEKDHTYLVYGFKVHNCQWGQYYSGSPGASRFSGRLCSHSLATLMVSNTRARGDFMGDRHASRELPEWNEQNYWMGADCEWEPCDRPDGEPYLTSDSGSQYWLVDGGVVRGADHWGANIGTSTWSMMGDEHLSAWLDPHQGVRYGKALWEDFHTCAKGIPPLEVVDSNGSFYIDVTPSMLWDDEVHYGGKSAEWDTTDGATIYLEDDMEKNAEWQRGDGYYTKAYGDYVGLAYEDGAWEIIAPDGSVANSSRADGYGDAAMEDCDFAAQQMRIAGVEGEDFILVGGEPAYQGDTIVDEDGIEYKIINFLDHDYTYSAQLECIETGDVFDTFDDEAYEVDFGKCRLAARRMAVNIDYNAINKMVEFGLDLHRNQFKNWQSLVDVQQDEDVRYYKDGLDMADEDWQEGCRRLWEEISMTAEKKAMTADQLEVGESYQVYNGEVAVYNGMKDGYHWFTSPAGDSLLTDVDVERFGLERVSARKTAHNLYITSQGGNLVAEWDGEKVPETYGNLVGNMFGFGCEVDEQYAEDAGLTHNGEVDGYRLLDWILCDGWELMASREAWTSDDDQLADMWHAHDESWNDAGELHYAPWHYGKCPRCGMEMKISDAYGICYTCAKAEWNGECRHCYKPLDAGQVGYCSEECEEAEKSGRFASKLAGVWQVDGEGAFMTDGPCMAIVEDDLEWGVFVDEELIGKGQAQSADEAMESCEMAIDAWKRGLPMGYDEDDYDEMYVQMVGSKTAGLQLSDMEWNYDEGWFEAIVDGKVLVIADMDVDGPWAWELHDGDSVADGDLSRKFDTAQEALDDFNARTGKVAQADDGWRKFDELGGYSYVREYSDEFWGFITVWDFGANGATWHLEQWKNDYTSDTVGAGEVHSTDDPNQLAEIAKSECDAEYERLSGKAAAKVAYALPFTTSDFVEGEWEFLFRGYEGNDRYRLKADDNYHCNVWDDKFEIEGPVLTSGLGETFAEAAQRLSDELDIYWTEPIMDLNNDDLSDVREWSRKTAQDYELEIYNTLEGWDGWAEVYENADGVWGWEVNKYNNGSDFAGTYYDSAFMFSSPDEAFDDLLCDKYVEAKRRTADYVVSEFVSHDGHSIVIKRTDDLGYYAVVDGIRSIECDDWVMFDSFFKDVQLYGYDEMTDWVKSPWHFQNNAPVYKDAGRVETESLVASRTAFMTPNGVFYNIADGIDPSWSPYDKSMAEACLANFGEIFVDEWGTPIDNEYDLEEIFEDFEKNGSRRAGRQLQYEDDIVIVTNPDGGQDYKGEFDYCPYKEDFDDGDFEWDGEKYQCVSHPGYTLEVIASRVASWDEEDGKFRTSYGQGEYGECYGEVNDYGFLLWDGDTIVANGGLADDPEKCMEMCDQQAAEYLGGNGIGWFASKTAAAWNETSYGWTCDFGFGVCGDINEFDDHFFWSLGYVAGENAQTLAEGATESLDSAKAQCEFHAKLTANASKTAGSHKVWFSRNGSNLDLVLDGIVVATFDSSSSWFDGAEMGMDFTFDDVAANCDGYVFNCTDSELINIGATNYEFRDDWYFIEDDPTKDLTLQDVGLDANELCGYLVENMAFDGRIGSRKTALNPDIPMFPEFAEQSIGAWASGLSDDEVLYIGQGRKNGYSGWACEYVNLARPSRGGFLFYDEPSLDAAIEKARDIVESPEPFEPLASREAYVIYYYDVDGELNSKEDFPGSYDEAEAHAKEVIEEDSLMLHENGYWSFEIEARKEAKKAAKKEATRQFTYAEMKELEDEIEGTELHNADRFKDGGAAYYGAI